jgi:hypothetical protein
MEITDPRPLLDAIDMTELERCLGYLPFTSVRRQSKVETVYSEPYGMEDLDDPESGVVKTEEAGPQSSVASAEQPTSINIIQGQSLILGDFIDTDAVGPTFHSRDATNAVPRSFLPTSSPAILAMRVSVRTAWSTSCQSSDPACSLERTS